MNRKSLAVALIVGCTFAFTAAADDRSDYNRRAAQRDAELFRSLDRNGDGSLTRDEVKGDLNLAPRFDDMDINRDGTVTAEELQRYLGQQYGVQVQATSR